MFFFFILLEYKNISPSTNTNTDTNTGRFLHPYHLHFLLQNIHQPPLSSSSFSAAFQLSTQHPSSKILTIPPLSMTKPSQP